MLKNISQKIFEIDNRQIPLKWELLKVKDILTRVKVGKRYNNKNSLFDGKIPIIDQSKDGILDTIMIMNILKHLPKSCYNFF